LITIIVPLLPLCTTFSFPVIWKYILLHTLILGNLKNVVLFVRYNNRRSSLVTLVSIIPSFHCKLQETCVYVWVFCEWSCVCECVNVCIIISSHILYYILVLFWYYCVLLCIHKRWKFTVNTRTLYGASLEYFLRWR